MNNDEIGWKDCWKKPVKVQYKEIAETVEIKTREGKLYGYAGKDVLIKGVRGEIYPCKIDIFNATYTTTAPLSEEQIRADTAKQIFKELDCIVVYRYKYKSNHVQIATGTEVMDGDYDYEAQLITFGEYQALKKEHKVD